MKAGQRTRPWTRLPSAVTLVLVLTGLLDMACNRRVAATDFPPNSLRVRYVPASDYTDCLVASVVMCANYVLGSDHFSPSGVRRELAADGLDPTRIGDVRMWLDGKGIKMVPLKGELSDTPPLGLGWWVQERGYPVICVVNKFGGNAEYNHAVVVIGVETGETAGQLGAVYVLDPASPRGVERWEHRTVEHYWRSTGQIMLLLFEAQRQ